MHVVCCFMVQGPAADAVAGSCRSVVGVGAAAQEEHFQGREIKSAALEADAISPPTKFKSMVGQRLAAANQQL